MIDLITITAGIAGTFIGFGTCALFTVGRGGDDQDRVSQLELELSKVAAARDLAEDACVRAEDMGKHALHTVNVVRRSNDLLLADLRKANADLVELREYRAKASERTSRGNRTRYARLRAAAEQVEAQQAAA